MCRSWRDLYLEGDGVDRFLSSGRVRRIGAERLGRSNGRGEKGIGRSGNTFLAGDMIQSVPSLDPAFALRIPTTGQY